LTKLKRDGMKIKGLEFALIKAYAKLGICFRGLGKVLIQPKNGRAESALNVHYFKIINNPSMTKWMVCRRNKLS